MRNKIVSKTTETITTTKNGKTQTQHIEIYKDSKGNIYNNPSAKCTLKRLQPSHSKINSIFPTKNNTSTVVFALFGCFIYAYYIKLKLSSYNLSNTILINSVSCIPFFILLICLLINKQKNAKINNDPILLKMKQISEDDDLKLPQLSISYWVENNRQANKKDASIQWVYPYIQNHIIDFKELINLINNFHYKQTMYQKEINTLYNKLSPPYLEKKQKCFKSMIISPSTEVGVMKISLKYHTPTGKYREYMYNFNKSQVKQIFNDIIKAENHKKIQQTALKKYKHTNQSTEAFHKLCIDCKIDPSKALTPNDIIHSNITSDLTGVYILHNITKGICYVGQATKINRRLKQHFSGEGCVDAYNDWIKGNVFIIERIPLVGSSFNTLDAQEKYYITKYDSFKNGYNKTQGNG